MHSSITNEKEQREAAYFEAIRTGLSRITVQGKLNKNKINEQKT